MESEFKIVPRTCETPDQFGVAAIINGAEVGHAYGQLNPGDETQADLSKIVVNEKRQGCGTALFDAFAKEAIERGANRLVAEIVAFDGSTDDEVARFYASNGAFVNSRRATLDLTTEDPLAE